MKNKNKLIILSILLTTNNIICSLTSLNGNILFWTSVGSKKAKGIKKMTSVSILTTIKIIISYVQYLEYQQIYLKIKGFNKNKKMILKFLNQSFFNILLVSDNTSSPHNGCKKVKKRRI